ncbi:cytochrome P450 [Nonomuraea gerenzanensis]|uniref:Putative cytochrome P450 hydroxylase n=1 Tax=Nonomuraea gerenzanensis TaxID=93944 RepID=A0A1M4EKI5_9ACTN|nr:cytochrome P450 [Nonomuraea gerenzanensis]UBU10825.1 cytochrome P450 [Nonomuraea gerenzanensis]SBO99258.1 putative cytochrome P450 hydroxylase [Nonomuraea gerenzanensis]
MSASDGGHTSAQATGADHLAARSAVEIFTPSTYDTAVPYDLFAHLRRESPVCWIPEPPIGPWREGPGFWAVFRHADVKHVLRTPEDFSSHLGATQIRDPDTPADLRFVQSQMLNMDPPAHSRLRRIVAAAFTPRAVRALERTIAERAAALFEQGECDFVEVAADLPVWTLAHVMGVPAQDKRLLYDWASRVIGYQDDDYAHLSTADVESLTPIGRLALAARPELGPGVNPRSRAALSDMFAYAHALARTPVDGESVMAAMREGGLTEAEFENMFFLFAVAGNETLRNGIPGGLLTLLQHPAELARLRADPALLDSAIEEMLRYWPPVMHFRRTATRDLTLAGRPVRAGDKVVVYHASANRDPSVFADPDRFDLARTPNDHVSFGFGPHFCLGAHLARAQFRSLFRELLAWDVELSGSPRRLTSNFQNGLKHLPVRLRRRS